MVTEKRFISLDEALDATHREVFWTESEAAAVRSFLVKQPKLDAVEVVHGRWLDNGMCNHKPSRFRNPDKWTVYKCSECGYSNGRRKNANYCPNCGAKMDEREEVTDGK